MITTLCNNTRENSLAYNVQVGLLA